MPSPIAIKRLPWMRQLSFISPKLARPLTLFSYDSLRLWAFLESHPVITRFCEYPGYVMLNDQQVFATFWVEGPGHQQFLVLEDDIHLEPEKATEVPTFREASVYAVSRAWLEPYRQWIDNWQKINPYLVSNGRFITPAMLELTATLFDRPIALFDAEYVLRSMEQQLARTAIFMLLHRGRLKSDDLFTKPLSGATLFCPNTTSPPRS
jgi:hypothetical protein